MGKALVVDDSKTDRTVVIDLLQAMGINVVTADSGEEGLEKAKNAMPDIIVLDVVLPGRSGFEVCRELKATDETKNIPVIMCSTKGSEMDKFWGMKQGADVYLPKPIDRDEFLKQVKTLIQA